MKEQRRVGVCLDTCHLLASGYDIASPEGYARTFKDFGRIVGFDRLKAFHMNDSKRPLGSRVDRHTHIGEGCVGLDAFRRLVNDRRFAGLPMLLETPKSEGKATGPIVADPLDVKNLEHAARPGQGSLNTSASNRQMVASFQASSGSPAL